MKKSMIQRLGCLVASISFAFVGATAFADAWFDGQISETPALTAGSGGFWNVPVTGWDSETKTYNNFNDPLKFTATESATIPSQIASIKTTVKFTAKDELLDSEIAGAKGGLAVLENEDSTATNYYGVVSGAWAKLSGTPDLTKAVEVNISLSAVGDKRFITYTIDNVALTLENGTETKIETSFGDGSATINSVEFLGKATITSLSGEKEASKFDLTVPVVAGATATVLTNGAPVTAKSENVYEIPYGANVKVTYAGTGVTVAGGTFTYENFDGSVTAVDTKDVKVSVALTVPTVANTEVEVKVGDQKVNPPATGNDYTFAYDTKNVTVTYTPDENYKFTAGTGVFTYESLTVNTTVDTTQFSVAEKTKYTVSFKTSLSDQPYYTKEVYEGAKLGEFTAPSEKKGYTGAWDTTPTVDDVIEGNTTYTYTYTAIDYTITVTVKGNVGGTASANLEKYNISDAAQTIALTATPSKDYKFSKWNFSKDGVSISGNTLTIAANTIGDIAIEAEFEEDKIVPIEPDPQETDVPKITVDKDALAKRGVDTSDIAKIKEYLKTTQPNGQKGWVNYALGIGDAAGVANKPVLVDESTEANKILIDLGIDYNIDETTGCSAKIMKVGDETGVQVSEDGAISLTDATATEVFTVKFVVTDKDGKAETVVEKNVGIENKAIASEMEILSVPFTDMNSAEQISVDKLIKTMNLAAGDRLMVYNGSKGLNEGWTFSEGEWTPDAGVGAAAETFVKPGDGIWFQRANPSESAKPVFKFGAFSATKAKTVAPADGWKLVANPNLTGVVDLNNGFVDNPAVDDEIQVETATVPTIYTYVDSKWGFDEVQVTGTSKSGRKITKKVRNTTDAKIGPGAGFWFGNSGTDPKNLDWSK